jgi:hypothetical protein
MKTSQSKSEKCSTKDWRDIETILTIAAFAYFCDSQPGAFFPTKGHLTLHRDIFGSHSLEENICI